MNNALGRLGKQKKTNLQQQQTINAEKRENKNVSNQMLGTLIIVNIHENIP